VVKISEAMTRNVQLARPDQTISDAARLMAELDIGLLPVREGDRLVGMLTDRDIAVRAVASGLGPETPVRDVMSAEVMYCFADQTVEEVARNMSDIQVRRLPVLSRDKRLVGIVSLCDLALEIDGGSAGDALQGISRPGGQHSQSDVTH
jgi:CBS domain-containing protein